MEKPFVGVIELLKTVYGEDHVRTGEPVPASVVAGLERELGAKLPDDYKQFVQTWGYLLAGTSGNITVWGIPPKGTELEYEVDVRRATEQLRAEVAERSEEDENLADAMKEAGVAIPACGWSEDFPHHTVHVFDAEGNLRWFLVKENAYDPPGGTTFTEYLHEQVQSALENKLSEAVDDALGGGDSDETIDSGPEELSAMHLHAVPPEVLAALDKEPRAWTFVRVYPPLEDYRAFLGDDPDDELPDDENGELVKRGRRFIAALGRKPPETLVSEGGYLMSKYGEALAVITERANHPAAVLFGVGAKSLYETEEEKVSLVTPDQLRKAVGSLGDLEERVRAGYDLAALREANAVESDVDEENHLDFLVGELDTVREAATAAAEQGWGWMVTRAAF